MGWSVKIAQFKGIPVFIHATFLLIIGWVALVHWMQGHNVATTLQGILFVLFIFLCVVLHEFGHALTAARFNIKTRSITLLPIGGVASLERMPERPREELLVALAGPLVNVVIAMALLAVLLVTNSLQPLETLSVTGGSLLERLMVVNLFLVAFNLLPAFPMDGGRVLRAILAMRLNYVKATSIAASIGQGMALLFGLLGLFGNPFLFFIAFFVWIGAAQEAHMTKVKFAFNNIPVSNAMITDYKAIRADEPLARAVELVIAGSQQDFPVIENGEVVGILEQKKLMDGLSHLGPDEEVRVVMDTYFQSVEVSEMLDNAMTRLQSCGCKIMPVLRHGRLAGLLTPQNIGEFMMIHSALQQRA